ncbi:MAG: transposase [Oscillospiraceae bacterium]|nr:transposase [Oscillospiraceae bacterium]
MGHSKDFKERAVSYRLEGHTVTETSRIFGIGTDTLNRWGRQYRETGDLSAKPLNRTFWKIDPEKLKRYVKEHPDAMQKEMAEVFQCSKSGICKALKQNKITFKKRYSPTKNKAKKK